MGSGGVELHQVVRRVRARQFLVVHTHVQQGGAAEPAAGEEVHVCRLPPAQVDLFRRQLGQLVSESCFCLTTKSYFFTQSMACVYIL